MMPRRTQREKKPFWVAFDPDRWEGGVAGLTPQAEFVFFRICKTIWGTGKGLKASQLRLICRGMDHVDDALEELRAAGKIKISSDGNILNEIALFTYKDAVERVKGNLKRTEKATKARLKKQLTPGKQTKKAGLDRAESSPKKRGKAPLKTPKTRKMTKKNTTQPLRKTTRKPGDRNDHRHGEQHNTTQHNTSSSYGNPSSNTPPKNRRSRGGAKKRAVDKDEKGNGFTAPLRSRTYEQAREAAPGWDIYHLEAEWRDWIDRKGQEPKDPDRAFLGFIRRHLEKNRL